MSEVENEVENDFINFEGILVLKKFVKRRIVVVNGFVYVIFGCNEFKIVFVDVVFLKKLKMMLNV